MKKIITLQKMKAICIAFSLLIGFSASIQAATFGIFNDNFDGGGTLSGWTAVSGAWTNTGVAGQGTNGQIMKDNFTGSDFIYEADFKLTAGIGQLTFRGNDNASAGYNLALGGGSIKLYTFPYVVLAEPTGYTFDINTWYHIKIEANGTSIKVYFNNGANPVIDVIDATFSSGRFGMNAYAGTFEFDNVKAVQYNVFNDNFDGGTLSGWTPVSGIWSNPGTVAQGDWNGGNGQIMKNDIVATDFIYEADIKLTTASPAGVLTFRGTNDGASEYLVALDGASAVVKLYTFPYAVLGTSPYTFVANTWYHLKIVANGTSIKVYFNNALTPVIDVTDATFASGKFGMNAWAGVSLFDNVKAEPLPELPGAPTSIVATTGNGQASVAFVAPVSDGGSAILDYTVTSSPGGFTKTGTSSPLVVTGLANGTSYSFTVTARNNRDKGATSIASNTIIPSVSTEIHQLSYQFRTYQVGSAIVVDLNGLIGQQTVSVFDIQGKCLLTRSVNGGENLTVSNALKTGVYLIKVQGLEKSIMTKLIVR
jgi:hypothetical protein